ncbi:NAD(P)H-dependent oxidoreductase, partial [Methylobacterium tarhaniae]|uniref:NAD(P)H-dependent oxidoreductase n=1 Tax=Methylobacterium tarhaniae TaxID=1187852 RepID=UPI003D0024D4
LHAAGHRVEVIDLYAEGFDPVLSADERSSYYDRSIGTDAVARHITALRNAEALVFVYPTWWFGMPAMLKGWIDRIWLPGIAFRLGGPNVLQPLLTHIRSITVVTTYGSPRWLLWLVGWPDWRLFRRGIRTLCAPRCRLNWLALTNMDGCTLDARQRFIARVRRRLATHR